MEIHTLELEPMNVAGIEHSGAYQNIGKAFEQLHDWLVKSGNEKAPLVAIYYDDPHNVPEENLRSLAGVILTSPPNDNAIKAAKIPGGRYAMASITGHYSGLPKAWEDFYGKIFGTGLKTKADLCFERYINTPMDTEPDDLITELYAPLA